MEHWYVQDNSKCVCGGFESNGFVTGATIPKWLVIIGHTSLVVWAT
jgi:hypothetical protein